MSRVKAQKKDKAESKNRKVLSEEEREWFRERLREYNIKKYIKGKR